MTTKAEVVKASFGAYLNVRAAAPMTTDAGALPAPIDVIVVTLNAVHRAMFVVGEVQNQPITARHERFPQSQGRASPHQGNQRDKRAEYDGQHKP
jgi:hypothetical protein